MSNFKIIGNSAPIVGKEEFYSVNSLLPNLLPYQSFGNTNKSVFEQPVKWEVYILENGRWRKTKENDKIGNKVSYTFLQKSLERKGIRVLVKRGDETARLDIKPQRAEQPKIDSIEFLDKLGNKPTQPFAYSQTLKARVHCLHMEKRTIYATLWEDDAAGAGHNKVNEKNKMITLPGTVKDGVADIDFFLNPDFAKIADAIKAKGDSSEGKTHEYYVTAEFLNKTIASTNTNVANPNDKKVAQNKQTPAQKKGASKKQNKVKSGNDNIYDWFENTFKIKPIIFPNTQPPTNASPLKVGEVKAPIEEEVKTEGILTAYFAKEEFTLETEEVAGQHEYKFQSNNETVSKDKIAPIIKKRVDAQVKADKKYAKLEDIKSALTESSYIKGATITFNLCKLGAKFIKISSVPLEEEVYVVAKTFLLDGKEVSITIKEKEAILAETDADLTVLESKEGGSDIAILKAVVEKGIAKVKIKLRPKVDEDLKKWKEKLLKGKKDEAYSYKFKNENVIIDSNKKQIAAIILNNAKEGKQGNTKIGSGKTAFVDDVEKALENKTYRSGDTISFDTYKTQTENLWLKAECQGDTEKHEGVFLKKDGEYFVIGKKCECEESVRAFMRMLRDEEGVAGEKGYETLCGGESFIKDYGKNWEDHPQIKVYIKRIKDYSSAAGAYQVMGYTWNNMSSERKKYNIPNFNPENQDRFIVALLKHKRVDPLPESVIKKYGEKFRNAHGDMIKMILNKDFDKLFLTASLEWASFPDSPYGQQRADYTIKDVKVKYNGYLDQELNDKSDLHIKKGFLQEFGYDCNCHGQNKKSVKQGYDIDKAVSYIESNAEIKSLSKCATYVRLAIEAGGLKSNTQPRNALNYFGILKELGFTELQTTTYTKGDIVVFDGVTGHQYGHIAMWTGTEWISDFKQKNIIVNNAYNDGKSSIFRWE